jgi:hypothetical protein
MAKADRRRRCIPQQGFLFVDQPRVMAELLPGSEQYLRRMSIVDFARSYQHLYDAVHGIKKARLLIESDFHLCGDVGVL